MPGLTTRLYTAKWDFLVKQSSVYSVGRLLKSRTRAGYTFIGLKLLQSSLLVFAARALWVNSIGIREHIGREGVVEGGA